jgi:(p)ppGpp synthase/HD superfamily hydrolase
MSDDRITLSSAAEEFARKAHENQIRWNGDPYITHPERIARQFQSEHLKAVAWLHDVCEDCGISVNEIRWRFGDAVANAVECITHKKNEQYFTYIARVGTNYLSTRVKLKDLEDNMRDLKEGKRKQKYTMAHDILSYRLQDDDF